MFQLFYQVIFPVNKQGSIESPPWKQRLENDAKEREKQTIVAKNQLLGLIIQAVSISSSIVASFWTAAAIDDASG